MTGQKDFLDIIREIRGSTRPGQPLRDGIWYELTVADKNGNPGIYGDILAKYGIVTESAGTFDQAIAILENLNVEVNTLPEGTQATSELINGVWHIGIPEGKSGIDGIDGAIPEIKIKYVNGDLIYTVTVDGIVVVNQVLLNLNELVDTVVTQNVGVQETLNAKQEVLDAVNDVEGLVVGFDQKVLDKKAEINTLASNKLSELDDYTELEKIELDDYTSNKIVDFDANALNRTNQYDENHDTKLNEYNANDNVKMGQYNANHVARLLDLNQAYAKRMYELIQEHKLVGAVDSYVPQVTTQQAYFISTVGDSFVYYVNGEQILEGSGYTVYNSTTIDLVEPINPNDVVMQIDFSLFKALLIHVGQITWDDVNIPNGVAGLDGDGKIGAAQLPSYVDDVLEFPTYADLPAEGEQGKIYLVVEDETHGGDISSYRWTGTVYALVTNTLDAQDVKNLYESIVGDVTAHLATKANIHSPSFTGFPKADTAPLGTSTKQLANTEFVKIEIANETYSKTELNSGQLDDRYYTETEIDTMLENQNDASEIGYDNTTSQMTSDNVQDAIDEIDQKLDLVLPKVSTLEQDMSIVKAKNTEQDGRLDSIEAKDLAQDSALSTIQNTLALAVDKNTEQDGRLDTLRDRVDLLEIADTAANDRMDQIEVDANALKNNVINLTTRVDGIDNSINSINNKITALENVDTETADQIEDILNELALKANAKDAVLTGIPTAPTASVGTDTTQLATTEFVKAEIASEAYSKTELDAGQLDNRYYTEVELDAGQLDNRYFTETELLNGALDERYYTESEIDAKLDAQNDASEINVTPSGNLESENVQAALEELQNDLDNMDTKINNVEASALAYAIALG